MTIEEMRTKITGELQRFSAAVVGITPDDQAFADKQIKRAGALHDLIERAETIPQLDRVQKRLTSVMREAASLLPASYFAQNRISANAALKKWIRRRDNLIKRLLGSSPWVLAPYRQAGDDIDDDAVRIREQSPRCCFAITAEERAAVVDEIGMLSIEAPAIAAMINVGTAKASRSMWLPLLAPAGFQKLVFCENTAYSVLPNTVMHLSVYVNKETVTLDVGDFLTERGWRRDQVSIRRASGSRFVARLWDAAGNASRILTHCVIVDYADDLSQRISSQSSRARRIDAKDPAATWYCYEFIFYPAGRPSRSKNGR
ncbi:MAG: hypothetical protein WA003_09995 [Desulfuromonadaceae bacterium]